MDDARAAHADHRREYRDFAYVYPVVSRRSRGVSIGVNLNPDKICNFGCVYCEVDRRTPPRVSSVDLAVLRDELDAMLAIWRGGALFDSEPFASVPPALRRLNDIAFSGDGEPTTCPQFAEAVDVAWAARDAAAVPDAKLVLITDAACLDRPAVRRGVARMARGPHEIWAKLDAGTEAYYRMVNRTSVPMRRVLDNITALSREFPAWVQSLFLRVRGEPPPPEEVAAYIARLAEIRAAGGQLLGVQAYTVARPTPEAWATALAPAELDSIADRIERGSALRVERFY